MPGFFSITLDMFGYIIFPERVKREPILIGPPLTQGFYSTLSYSIYCYRSSVPGRVEENTFFSTKENLQYYQVASGCKNTQQGESGAPRT